MKMRKSRRFTLFKIIVQTTQHAFDVGNKFDIPIYIYDINKRKSINEIRFRF